MDRGGGRAEEEREGEEDHVGLLEVGRSELCGDVEGRVMTIGALQEHLKRQHELKERIWSCVRGRRVCGGF